VGLLAAATRLGHLDPAPTLVAVIVVAVYRPAYRVLRRASVFRRAHAQPYELLSETTTRLGSTLAACELATIISDGLRAIFHDPPLALYIRRRPTDKLLERIMTHRVVLPHAAPTARVNQVFRLDEVLLPIGVVQQRAGPLLLAGSEAALVFGPLVSLWGIIRDAEAQPIGLLVLGPRSDLDPYRARDVRELSRLLSAAGLAFTNSASCMTKC